MCSNETLPVSSHPAIPVNLWDPPISVPKLCDKYMLPCSAFTHRCPQPLYHFFSKLLANNVFYSQVTSYGNNYYLFE